MKMRILVGLAAILMTVTAQAAPRKKGTARMEPTYERSSAAEHGSQNMAGCGLGSMVVRENNKWAQVGAAFLNGTGFQTFGITFGTSNCTEDGVASAAREKEAFVESNLADIRRDVSVGSGEYLSSLASFYGCKGENTAAFGRALQKHQDQVVGASAEDATRVIDTVVTEEKASCQG